MSQYPISSYETQFEAHSDDEENLYNVEKILAEKGNKYLIQWEGIDPTTGEKWAPDWVPKTDCTDDLIADWKREKAEKKQKGRVPSVKRTLSASGSANTRPSKSRSVSGRSTGSRATEASTSTRSRSPVPRLKTTTTSRRKSSFYIDLPPPRLIKRRRDSDIKEEPMSPVKRMKLGGPASPLPASPFDNDDGGVGATFPKKRSGPVTYKRRKPAVVKSPSFPKLTGPYVRDHVGESSRHHDPPHPEPTKRQAEGSRTGQENDDGANTDTETEDESLPSLPPKLKPGGRTSPLKSKSEPVIKPRTRNATRNAPLDGPPRASSVPFERQHPTSAARTRELPFRKRSTQREVKKQIILGLPGLPEDYPWWPMVVTRDETLRRRSGTKSRTSSDTNTSRKSLEEVLVAGPSVPLDAVPVAEAEVPRPTSPAPPAPSSDTAAKRSSLAKSVAASSGRPSSAKSVSFRVEGVDDYDEYQADHLPPPGDRAPDQERIMSSIEPENENEPVSREPTKPAPIEQPRSQSQSQSNSESSKSTHISDSQGGDEEGNKDDCPGNRPENEAKESKARVEDLGLALHGPDKEDEGEQSSTGEEEEEEEEDQESSSNGEEEDQEKEKDQEGREDQEEEVAQGGEQESEQDDHDEIESEEAVMHSSPSLGGDFPDLPPASDAGVRSPGHELSPPPGLQLDQPIDPPGDTGSVDEELGFEQPHEPEESAEETDGDASMAHAVEVDMLLSSDVSHRSEPSDHEMEQEQEESIPDGNVVDPPESTLDSIRQEHHAEEPLDSTQTQTDSSSGRMPAPDARAAIDHPTAREVISALLPGILDTSSQSQSQSRSLPTDTQDRALIPPSLPAQIISDVLVQTSFLLDYTTARSITAPK
ncbi:unnamed protein product [Rhizoctonia solani]|uniref:Chromo domain-containing protein n=1 Tax=Rhizoctonia solani TaxID=456999 RepID=A0A8H3EBT3_9AGAM|nr:unnamed protein product [Rhizoctonia solani]